ncbi:MAG: hypothetical protein WCA32_05875 [Chromatiaceae bacterium]
MQRNETPQPYEPRCRGCRLLGADVALKGVRLARRVRPRLPLVADLDGALAGTKLMQRLDGL